ncbi:MAG: tyrosine-protein phosphatase [Halieaceae bacterium]|nr:tyrosine-protein phosphatase [Halieaceae bacterium]
MALIKDSVIVSCESDGTRFLDWSSSRMDTEVTAIVEEEGKELRDVKQTLEDTSRIAFHGLPRDRRYQYRLTDSYGNEVLQSERRLSFDKSKNFRDCGGYPTKQRSEVKWGSIFRSGQLSKLDNQDIKVIESLNLDLIFDFRREDEQEMEPSRLPKNNMPRVVRLPINPGSSIAFYEQLDNLVEEGADAVSKFMIEINRDFVKSHSHAFSKMFEEILSVKDARFLFHCSAGKDRTGFAAALILHFLGVSMDVIEYDYMLSKRYFQVIEEVKNLQRKYGIEHLSQRALYPMLDVRHEYIRAAIERATEEFGNLDEYLAIALGLTATDKSEFRRRYCLS